jgi:hypothetical protein
MADFRLKILEEARNILDKEGGSRSEKETVIKLLDILAASLEKLAPGDNESIQILAHELINNRSLLAMLRQQTDELDALKKLSINLTSSLDLPDVLDAVVSEAMRLIENAHDVNIFLYKNNKLSFGRDAQQTLGNPQVQWLNLYRGARWGNDHCRRYAEASSLSECAYQLDWFDHRYSFKSGKYSGRSHESFPLHRGRLFPFRIAIAQPAFRSGSSCYLKC